MRNFIAHVPLLVTLTQPLGHGFSHATRFSHSIVDNGLLRQITKIGQYHLYSRFYDQLSSIGAIDTQTWQNFTPGGIIEFLGINIPKVELPDATKRFLEDAAAEIAASSPPRVEDINKIRARLILAIETCLREKRYFSKSELSARVALQKTFTEDLLIRWSFASLDRLAHYKPARDNLYRGLAIDRSYNFSWPGTAVELFRFITLDEILQFAHEPGHGSYRPLYWLAHGPAKICRELEEAYLVPRTVSKQVYDNNWSVLQKAAHLKPHKDFLDAEAVYAASIGYFENGRLNPILLATREDAKAILIRLGLFRSFHIFASKLRESRKSENPAIFPGCVAVFNEAMDLEFLINVEQIPPLLHSIRHGEIEVWLAETMAKFSMSRR
jgi:hypothetical protein